MKTICQRTSCAVFAFLTATVAILSGCSANPDCSLTLSEDAQTSWEWKISIPSPDAAKLCLSLADFDGERENPSSFIVEQTLHSKESRMQIQTIEDRTCPVHFSGDDWKAEVALLQTPDSGWVYATPLEQAELILREPVPLLEFHYHEPGVTDHSRCQIVNVQFMAPRDFIK